jgi:hypothetical protein
MLLIKPTRGFVALKSKQAPRPFCYCQQVPKQSRPDATVLVVDIYGQLVNVSGVDRDEAYD